MKNMLKFVAIPALLCTLAGCNLLDTDDDSENHQSLSTSVTIKDGKFTDSRDKKSYSVVEIGGKLWFAENLRYIDSSKTSSLKGNVWCFDNDSKNCDKYGVLYSWTAAMNIDEEYLSKQEWYKAESDVCPTSWHLPSDDEWHSLQSAVDYLNGSEGTGTSLKDVNAWEMPSGVAKGTNRFGFYGLPAGRRNNDGGFMQTEKYAFFWTSTGAEEGTAYGWTLRYDNNVLDFGEYYRDHGMSVRCVLNSFVNVKYEGEADSSYLQEIPHDYGSLKIGKNTYKTIEIDSLIWMAENANEKTDSSWCYNNVEDSCKVYGRLYNYDDALTVCPDGWRLPTSTEMNSLVTYAASTVYLRNWDKWNTQYYRGIDFWGFNAYAAGGYESGDFFDLKTTAYFWLSDTVGSTPYVFRMKYSSVDAEVMTANRNLGYSVRCIKDGE